ncbi:uncharacterized protein LOC135485848 [Lineus longissimus]|uniref:uncharacterized protein LOC135485848 n=1 Tax=Lineus longissimus TaxID=88925 RepID=UPI002B4DC2E5
MFFFKFSFMCVILHATFGQTSGNFFKSGQRYTYVYRGEAISQHDTLPAGHAVFRFQCYLHIDMQDFGGGRLQVEGCQLRDDGTNLHKRSDEFASAVQRYSMYFQLQNETYITKLFTEHDEQVDITNFKRGAISSILFKQSLAPGEQEMIRQVLVQGACQTSYTADDSGGQVERLVNLSSCDTHTNHNSTSKCTYYITNVDSEPRLTSIECDETYFVNQLDFLGSLGNSSATTTKLRQTYNLHVTPTASNFDFQHLASSKRVTTLAYDPTREKVSADRLRQAFKDMTDELDISAMPTKKAVALFEEVADVLPSFDRITLWGFLQESWDCTHCSPTQKSLRQSCLLDALMACGTASCVETYARAAVEGYISGAKVKLFLLDVALKKKASLPIIQAVFRLCKKDNDRVCWLNLGSMIHTFYEETGPISIQVSSEILTIVAYLHRIIGTNCEPFINNFTNRIIKHYDIVLTLKTIGNIGSIIQTVDRDLRMNGQVLPTLLKCARNTNVSHSVAMEAIQALRRLTPDDNLTTQLLGLLRSRIHPMIRIATYKILMKAPTLGALKEIVRLVQTERSEHFKSYVVSHLNSILESEDPAMTSVQGTLLKCLAEDEISLPKPLKNPVTLSHHKNFYKTFSIPKLGQPIGVKIDVDVIYDPSARIPGSIRVNLTLNAFRRSLNLLDCGLSMQYMEVILRKLLGHDAEVLLQFFGIPSFEKQYQHTTGQTQFNNIRRTILDNIQQLDDSVTMGGVPDLTGDLRIFGHEIVFGNLNDLKPILGLFENLTHLTLKDLLNLFLEHDLRKDANLDEAVGLTREKTILPTILGVPLTVTSSSHALISLHPRLNTQRHERSKSMDLGLAAGGFFNMKTKLAVSIPGFVETATSWSGHVNGSVDFDMKAKIEFSVSGVKLTLSNPFEKIKRDVFTVSTRQTLIIDGMEQEVTLPDQQPIKSRCSSFYQISGIRLCVGVRLPLQRHKWLPFLPLSGPFTLNIGLESAQRSSQYTMNFVFLQPYRRGQPGRSAGSSFSSMNVTLQGSKDLSTDVGRSQTTISFQAKGELLKYRSVDDKPAYKLDFSISNGEKKLFDIKYYKTMHEEPLQSPVPSVFIRFPATVSINVSSPVAYLAMVGATLHRTPRDFSTQLNVTYFCADQTSFCYRFHIQPQRAYHPGHVTELSNKITVKGDRINGTGWTEVTYLLKFPGQNFQVSTSTNFLPRSSVTDAEMRWLAKDGTQRVVQAKSDLSVRKTNKGVELEHVVNGSSEDWSGEANWSLLRGRRGNVVEVDFSFDVYSKGKRGFDSPLKLSNVWTPQASHTTVTLPQHDVAIHYLVDKSDPTYRNMTFYHENLSKEEHHLDISWQMALDRSHRLFSNVTVTPSGQRGLSTVSDHIKQVALVWVKSARKSLDHSFLPKGESDMNCSIDGLSLMEHLLFIETRICLYLWNESTSCKFGPPYRIMDLVPALRTVVERAKTSLYQAITRNNIPRRIGPDRPWETMDKHFYSSVRLPFEWKDFDALPTLAQNQKGLLKRLKGMIQKLKNKEVISQQSEPRYQTAMIFGVGYVQTFDGLLYEHPGYRSNRCAYLLAREFDSSVFSIMSTVDAVTLLLPNLAISIDGENRVAVNMTDRFIELPFTSRDGNVVIHADGPYVNVHTSYGIDATCDSVNFQCLFNISEMYHNHTLGLLGTNDGEQLNDMRKPTGRLAAGIVDFVDAYEVSGKAECLYNYGFTSPRAVSPTRTCANDTSPTCKKLFHERRSSFSDCFRVIKPLSYMDFCVEIVKNSDVSTPSSTLCSLSAAYVTACRSRGVNIKHLDSCTSCNGRPNGAIWQQTIQKTADIVFIISQHGNVSMQHDFNPRLQHLAHRIEHALVGREGYDHLRYGLVGFAGAGMRGPNSFTIDGHLFGPYQEFHRVLRQMQYTDQKKTDALDAVRLAASYPFRAEASRVVILVTGKERDPSRPREPLVDVLHALQRNSIRLYTVSRYPDLTRRASVIGITCDNQLVTNNRKTSVVVSDFPKGDYAKLSKTTQGAVFSLHHLIHSPIPSRLYSHLSNNIRQQVAGEVTKCRKCECLQGRAGEGVASCKNGSGEC